MIHLLNDRGETVVSVGMPGSVMNAQCAWPSLIDKLKTEDLSGLSPEARAAHVAQKLHAAGVPHGLDATAVLEASGVFGERDRVEVCEQLKVIREYADAELSRITEPFRPLSLPGRTGPQQHVSNQQ